jgi:hypothetical protein
MTLCHSLFRKPDRGGGKDFWDCWRRTWSSAICWFLASSSACWAWTWACRLVTSSRRAEDSPSFGPLLTVGGAGEAPASDWSSMSGNSTSQTNPCGVGDCLAGSSPLCIRRLIVSTDTPSRTAASWTDTLAKAHFPSFGLPLMPSLIRQSLTIV